MSGPHPQIWGILNLTPDSFSDGGAFLAVDEAVKQAALMVRQGASVIDLGGESTRPRGSVYGQGASEVPWKLELTRVLPVLDALAHPDLLGSAIELSIDTTKPEVAKEALKRGCTILNDTSGATSRELIEIAAKSGAKLVIMHNRGRGEVAGENVKYNDIVKDVRKELLESAARAERWGVEKSRIWLDPGLGFAKNPNQSLQVLANVRQLVDTGFPVLIGPSRKAFLAAITPRPDGSEPTAPERDPGTASLCAWAAQHGVAACRVHEVEGTRQAMQALGFIHGAYAEKQQ